jgi:hypothetical protein
LVERALVSLQGKEDTMDSGKPYILQYRPGGEIIEMDPDGGNRRTLLGDLLDNVDGILIDKRTKTLYWTNMGPAAGPGEGEFFQADGSIECFGLNGANRRTLVGHGLTVTPKQVTADFDAGFLYWCDREGTRDAVIQINLHPAERYISANLTCDIGMRKATGKPYESFAFTLEELTRPQV